MNIAYQKISYSREQETKHTQNFKYGANNNTKLRHVMASKRRDIPLSRIRFNTLHNNEDFYSYRGKGA